MFETKSRHSATNSSDDGYSSSDVAQIAKVSLRQLQWWDERKVVSPRHVGHKRVYSQEEVVEIAVIAELRRKGFSLQKIRRVIRFLHKEMGARLADLLREDADMHLLTDGKTVYLEDKHERIIDILKGAKQAMFLVCVSDQVRRLQAEMGKPVKKAPVSATARPAARHKAM